MAEVSNHSLTTIGLLAGGVLGVDYLFNGPRSIVGKLLGHNNNKKMRHFPHWVKEGGIPTDPLHGEKPYAEPSVGYKIPGWVYPIKTARAPFPALIPDVQGRIKIPIDHRGGDWHEAQEVAAESIANLVFNDMSVLPEKSEIGTSVEIRNNILAIMRSPDCPELFRRLVEFHHRHGPAALDMGSPLYNQEIKLAGSCADLYEGYFGLEKWFARTGNAYVAEYDDLNDRLAAEGARSPIQFNIGGAYYIQ